MAFYQVRGGLVLYRRALAASTGRGCRLYDADLRTEPGCGSDSQSTNCGAEPQPMGSLVKSGNPRRRPAQPESVGIPESREDCSKGNTAQSDRRMTWLSKAFRSETRP